MAIGQLIFLSWGRQTVLTVKVPSRPCWFKKDQCPQAHRHYEKVWSCWRKRFTVGGPLRFQKLKPGPVSLSWLCVDLDIERTRSCLPVQDRVCLLAAMLLTTLEMD